MASDPNKLHAEWVPLLAEYKTQINDVAGDIDPHSEYDWFALTYGWAIAKGLSVGEDPKGAHAFAIFIRYNTDMG